MAKYRVYVTPDALEDVKSLPGHIRQRVRGSIRELADQPRPPQSKQLYFPDSERQLFRLRLKNWRIIYAITEPEQMVDVLAVKRRPPYDYGDLAKLLEEIK